MPKFTKSPDLAENIAAAVERTLVAQRAVANNGKEIGIVAGHIEALKAKLSTANDFDSLCSEIEEEERRLRRIMMRGEVLERELQVAQFDQVRLAHQNVVDACRSAFRRRDARARAVAQTVEQFVKAYRAWYEAAGACRLVWPDGEPPQGAVLSNAEMRAALEAELYRVGANPDLLGNAGTRGPPTVPGAQCHDLALRGTPSKLQSLVDRSEQATAHAMRLLTGEPADDPSSEDAQAVDQDLLAAV